MLDPAPEAPILRPGETCWKIAHADRLAVIIDAADYFATIRDAVRNARHSVILVGWDFDTRIGLDPRDDAAPNELGRFLNWVVRARPDLRIYLLKWGLGWIQSLGRASMPLRLLDLMSNRRIHFRLDHAHPSGSAHHQKIVAIDDALAFCGGIDMTADRWDTRDHLDDHPLRRRPTTRRAYGPWHDATAAVDGEAARALGDLARERWFRATGKAIPPPPPTDCVWPSGLTPSFEHVEVGISRSAPPHGGRAGVFEIEALYLEIVARARRSLYIESQYFASHRIAEAMAARLREADGPEIVVVNPESAYGWLEEEVMGSSRARLMRLVQEADVHGRFRLYTPVAAQGTPIYVHAKVLVMDDSLLRVGSSNLNNRSLGHDTECDLTIEAGPGETELRRRIAGLRTDLLAEHLGCDNAAVEAAVESAGGSIVAAIEALRGEGRSLVPFEPPELNLVEETVMSENALLDPERPRRQSRRSAWRALPRRLWPFAAD